MPLPPLPVSSRSAIEAFIVMDVMREANARQTQGQDIIHMEVGQPGTPAPLAAREAAKRAIDAQALGYTDALGLPALRERIARHYLDFYGVAIESAQVVITTGSSAGFILAFLALLEPGDGIALPVPGYPCYRQIAKVLGLNPVFMPAGSESGFKVTPKALDHALSKQAARAVVLASPANPTGAMLSPRELQALAGIADARRAWFISDEIYHGLTYGIPAATALAYSSNAVVINSFSKYFSMTGWRIGWMVVPQSLTRVLERLTQNLYISPPTLSQLAALAAFDSTDEIQSNKAGYAKNRAMLLEELPRAGFTSIAPADGAFYLYADVSALAGDSMAFVERMLYETGVAAAPGTDFDSIHGHQFVRFSYAGQFDTLHNAAKRLKAWRDGTL